MREIQRDIVAAVIESSDGFLLFGKNRKGGVYQGCWVIPGGGIDEGETKEQALHREVMEETGINLHEALVRMVSDHHTGSAVKTISGEEVQVAMKFNEYHAVLSTDKAMTEFAANDDLIELSWFAKEDLEGLTLSEPTIELLEDMGYM